MAFRCPDCSSSTLEIVRSLLTEPDQNNDEAFFQLLECKTCALRGLALYEESKRASLNEDNFHHIAYRIEEEDFANLLKCSDRKFLDEGILRKQFIQNYEINFEMQYFTNQAE